MNQPRSLLPLAHSSATGVVAFTWWLFAALTAATILPPASSLHAPPLVPSTLGRGGDADAPPRSDSGDKDEGSGGGPPPSSNHQSGPKPPPLILLLVLDQFRYDALRANPNSNPFTTTPNMDCIARDGVTFTNAFTSTPTCTPARSALLTGRGPWGHGMLGYGSMSLEYPFELIRALGQGHCGGYHTAAIGKNHFGWRDVTRPVLHSFEQVRLYDGGGSGFANTSSFGYDDYDAWFQHVMPGRDPLATGKKGRDGKEGEGMGWNSWRGAPYGYDEYYHPTAWTTREALKFLDAYFDGSDDEDEDSSRGNGHYYDGSENRSRRCPERNEHPGTEGNVMSSNKKPLFLKVSYHRPHSPYDPPRRLLEKKLRSGPPPPYPAGSRPTDWDYRYRGGRGPTNNDTTNCGPSDPDAWCGDMPPSQSRVSRAAYLANVEFVDEGIGRVIDLLKEMGLYDRSLILLTSDHGDMQGEHHLWRKGYPYQGSVHVPMIVKWPTGEGGEGGEGGAQSETMSSTSTRRARVRSDDGNGGHLDGLVGDVGMDGEATTRIPRGGTLDQVVELRDLLPTILGAAGVPLPHNVTLDGRDLMHLVRQNGSSSTGAGWREYIDLEHSTVYGYSSWNALTDGRYKYVFHAATGTEQLFHLETDPNEMVDLVAAASSSSSTSPDERERNMASVRHWRGRLVAQFEMEGRGTRWVLDGELQIRGGRGVKYGPNFPGDPAPRGGDFDEAKTI